MTRNKSTGIHALIEFNPLFVSFNWRAGLALMPCKFFGSRLPGIVACNAACRAAGADGIRELRQELQRLSSGTQNQKNDFRVSKIVFFFFVSCRGPFRASPYPKEGGPPLAQASAFAALQQGRSQKQNNSFFFLGGAPLLVSFRNSFQARMSTVHFARVVLAQG